MELDQKTIVVTGAARGIGRALAKKCAASGSRVVLADLPDSGVQEVAAEFDSVGLVCDVTDETQVQKLVHEATSICGPIDLFCSNAGVCFGEPDHAASADNTVWQTCWDLHVMAQVYAARAVLPDMLKRSSGYLLNVASAAGLLNQIGDAAYSATKHAAVGFAESLAISHGDDGIKVSVVCPQYVSTPMLGYTENESSQTAPLDLNPNNDTGKDKNANTTSGVLTPERVAEAVIKGIQEERFLILPHADVQEYIEFKAKDTDRWLGGMRKLRRRILKQVGSTHIVDMHKWV